MTFFLTDTQFTGLTSYIIHTFIGKEGTGCTRDCIKPTTFCWRADSEITAKTESEGTIKNLNPILLFICWASLTGIRAILCSSALFVLCGLLYSREMNYSETQVYSENKMAPRQIQIEDDTLQFLSSTGWNLFSWEWIASRMCLAGVKLHRRLCVQFQIANSEQTCFLFRCNYICMDECATMCQRKQL